ncbi:MAG: T9SS type A sorting domain-containing protein [Bacteroidales bacterium]|nr:T9SS type A sorting domain-containing protein [Bacteroidales bacterium]
MKTPGIYFNGLVMAILFFTLVGRSVVNAQSTLPDTVVFRGANLDIGKNFRTSGFPNPASFGHYTINSYFKEPNGSEHVAYVDNYNLYYFKSTDDGENWSKEQIITSHEGDIRNCALTVDTAGKVFIGITVNNNLNYSNPSATSYGTEWYFDLYCVNNKTGSWVKELVNTHPGNYGSIVEGLFVDAGNHVHIVANYYGWYSNGGTVWEWIRNATSNTWGATTTIVKFTDAPVDRFIYNTLSIVPDRQGSVTIVMSRELTTTAVAKPRLFYVRYTGTSWAAPVTVTDSIAVAWNRFDAWVDTADHTYIAYLKNNKLGVPELKISIDFQPAQTVSLNLAPNDTLNYFRMHCNAEGLFTLYLNLNKVKNPNTQVTFSHDAVHWSDPIPIPADIKRFISGAIVKTDTRRGYFAEYCKQIIATAGPRTALPYGPDTLFYGSIKLIENQLSTNEDPFSARIILNQSYPNPFTGNTTISWQLPQKAHVVLKVYDFTGREVKTLVDYELSKGEHQLIFNAMGLPTGVYFYQLQANGRVETKKMILLK